MAKKRKKGTIKGFSEEGQVLPITIPADSSGGTIEVFKSLTIDEQDEVLSHVLSEGGLERLLALAHASEMPVALDLFLDRVRYHHFLPLAEEDEQ